MAEPSGLLAILAKPKGKASAAEEEDEAPASERGEKDESADVDDAFSTLWDAIKGDDKETALEAFKTAVSACMAGDGGEDY